MASISDTRKIERLEKQLEKLHVHAPIPSYAAAQILENPIDIYRSYLANILEPMLKDARSQIVYDSIQYTNSLSHGDLILVVPRLQLKRSNPNEVAKDIASKFPTHPLFEPTTAVGIRLQLFFKPKSLPPLLIPYILDRSLAYGHNPSLGLKPTKNVESARKRLVIDFSSPNIAKEFHAGHLRSTIIGAYVSNLYKSMGWEVVNMNYLGDWGKQFGLVVAGWKRFGSEEAFTASPLSHLLDVYVKANALFKQEKDAVDAARARKEDTSFLESQGIFAERDDFFGRLEAREPEALALWKRFRDVSIQRYIEVYARLNISFDDYSGESQISPETIERVQTILTEKGVLQFDNGALIIDFKKHGAKHLDIAVVRNRQGTTTYLLRDIAATLERAEKYDFDQMIYVFSAEQDVYLQRLFKAIDLLGYPDLAKKLLHVSFGRVQGMSSRMGKVELLGDILDKCGSKMHEKMKSNENKYNQVADPEITADKIGISAMMVQDMSGKRIHDYPFNFDAMVEPIGDTGPYLQFSHARLCSIIRKSGYTTDDLASADYSLLQETPIIDTMRLMAQYSDVTAQAYKTLEPTTILTYLFKLNHQISHGYEIIRVIDIPEGAAVSIARAAYYDCARQVLGNGLRLLGITPVERM